MAVPISGYIGLFLVFFAMSFVLYTVASFIVFGMSQAIRRHAVQMKGFIGSNFRRVAIFSLANSFSATVLIAWQLSGFVPPDLGGALVGPLVIIVITLALTTIFWLIALIIDSVVRAKKEKQ